MAGIPGALNAAGTGQEDNFYPYEETPVEYLLVTEKYMPALGRKKFVNDGMLMLQDVQCTWATRNLFFAGDLTEKNNSTFHDR